MSILPKKQNFALNLIIALLSSLANAEANTAKIIPANFGPIKCQALLTQRLPRSPEVAYINVLDLSNKFGLDSSVSLFPIPDQKSPLLEILDGYIGITDAITGERITISFDPESAEKELIRVREVNFMMTHDHLREFVKQHSNFQWMLDIIPEFFDETEYVGSVRVPERYRVFIKQYPALQKKIEIQDLSDSKIVTSITTPFSEHFYSRLPFGKTLVLNDGEFAILNNENRKFYGLGTLPQKHTLVLIFERDKTQMMAVVSHHFYTRQNTSDLKDLIRDVQIMMKAFESSSAAERSNNHENANPHADQSLKIVAIGPDSILRQSSALLRYLSQYSSHIEVSDRPDLPIAIDRENRFFSTYDLTSFERKKQSTPRYLNQIK